MFHSGRGRFRRKLANRRRLMFCLCKHLVFVSTQSAREVQAEEKSVSRKKKTFLANEIVLTPEKSYLWIVWFNISMQFWEWLKNNKSDWIQQPKGSSRTLSIIVSRGQTTENLDVPPEQSPQIAQLSQFRWIDEFSREKYLLFHLFFSVKAVGKQKTIKSITIYKIK